jgi:hypothetical protein
MCAGGIVEEQHPWDRDRLQVMNKSVCLPSFDDLLLFSHVRAWQYFVESIRRPEAFLADRCEFTNNESKECAQSVQAFMGLKASSKLRGKYYLTTNSAAPFGRNFPI